MNDPNEPSETGDYFEWTGGDTLHPYRVPENQEWRDGESNNEWLKRIGYEYAGFMGIADVHELRWFARKDDKEEWHAFIAILTESSRCKIIFVPRYDGLLRLRAMIAPMISQSMLEVHLLQLNDTAKKAFRVWHGHDAILPCGQCDPGGMKEMRAREQRAAGKPANE